MRVIEQAERKINEYFESLKMKDLILGEIEKRQYNYEFSVSHSSIKDKVKLQVYFGKKGVKTVIQGNKESELYRIVDEIVNDQQPLGFVETSTEEFDKYIGSDETGKGDLFGPLIVCAFYFNVKDKALLVNAGVKDSKDMSANQISDVAEYLIKKYEGQYSIVQINPEKYNELYDKFRNLNKLLNWAHSKAISNLTEQYECPNIIVDKFSNETINISNGDATKYNIVQTHKGERFTGVAAASIIARYKFDMWFKFHTKNRLSKGASNETAKLAEKIFDNYGIDELRKLAKIHFKSISKIIA